MNCFGLAHVQCKAWPWRRPREERRAAPHTATEKGLYAGDRGAINWLEPAKKHLEDSDMQHESLKDERHSPPHLQNLNLIELCAMLPTTNTRTAFRDFRLFELFFVRSEHMFAGIA